MNIALIIEPVVRFLNALHFWNQETKFYLLRTYCFQSVNVFYVQIAIGNRDWFCKTFLQQLSTLNVDNVIIKARFVASTKPHDLNSKS